MLHKYTICSNIFVQTGTPLFLNGAFKEFSKTKCESLCTCYPKKLKVPPSAPFYLCLFPSGKVNNLKWLWKYHLINCKWVPKQYGHFKKCIRLSPKRICSFAKEYVCVSVNTLKSALHANRSLLLWTSSCASTQLQALTKASTVF